MVNPWYSVGVKIDENLIGDPFEISDYMDWFVFLEHGKYYAIEAFGRDGDLHSIDYANVSFC